MTATQGGSLVGRRATAPYRRIRHARSFRCARAQRSHQEGPCAHPEPDRSKACSSAGGQDERGRRGGPGKSRRARVLFADEDFNRPNGVVFGYAVAQTLGKRGDLCGDISTRLRPRLSCARTDAGIRSRLAQGGPPLPYLKEIHLNTLGPDACPDRLSSGYPAYAACILRRRLRNTTSARIAPRKASLVTTVPQPMPPLASGCDSQSPNDAPSGRVRM